MKKFIYSALTLSVLLVSCNQKNKEVTTGNSNMMKNDSTMMNNKSNMMDNHTKIYSCPMHPEVQGKLNDKCSKCGMKLTEPVPEREEESK